MMKNNQIGVDTAQFPVAFAKSTSSTKSTSSMVCGLAMLLASTLSCSCGQKQSTPAAKPVPAVSQGVPAAGIDIGDVEFALILDAVLAEKSQTPNITSEELINAKQQLDLVTLDVAVPYPEALWITLRQSFATKLKSARIVLRATIFRDKAPIGSFAVLLDSAAPATPYEYTFNAFAGLSPLPETMLISAQAEVILLPAGTDPAQIDVNTYKGGPDNTGAVLSNPVRINLGTPSPSSAGKESP